VRCNDSIIRDGQAIFPFHNPMIDSMTTRGTNLQMTSLGELHRGKSCVCKNTFLIKEGMLNFEVTPKVYTSCLGVLHVR
jgi:hypothetical protein